MPVPVINIIDKGEDNKIVTKTLSEAFDVPF